MAMHQCPDGEAFVAGEAMFESDLQTFQAG
jgi:hypothetical protein